MKDTERHCTQHMFVTILYFARFVQSDLNVDTLEETFLDILVPSTASSSASSAVRSASSSASSAAAIGHSGNICSFGGNL